MQILREAAALMRVPENLNATSELEPLLIIGDGDEDRASSADTSSPPSPGRLLEPELDSPSLQEDDATQVLNTEKY